MQDFFTDALAYIDNKENQTDGKVININRAKPEAPITPLKVVEDIEEHKDFNKPFICPSGSSVIISEDGRTLTIQGEVYEVPEWYNKEQIKKRDAKTIEMVFIHYGLIFDRHTTQSQIRMF